MRAKKVRGTELNNSMRGGDEIASYENLANAIIAQAVDDYRKALKHPEKQINKEEIEELEEFFVSEYFKSLTDVDGKRLMNLVRIEMGEEKK